MDDVEGEERLVGGEGGCEWPPPLMGRVDGSRLAGATSSPYRNPREKLTEEKKRDTNPRKLEMDPRTILVITSVPEGIPADHSPAIILF